MITIAVFDDHAERREALSMLINFQKDMACIGNYEDCSNLVESFRNGAPDVVLMDIHMPGIDGIEGVNGGAPTTPAIARRVLQHFGQKTSISADDEYNLSTREKDIPTHMVKGMSHKMITAELYISVFTVGSHIKNIYQKLQVHSVSEAVATAIQKNIVR